MRGPRSTVLIGLGYLALFLVLFAQFPRKGSIPGNCDTWYAIAFTNLYMNELRELFGAEPFGGPLYPVANPFSYGETSVGCGVPLVALRMLGFGEITAYYLFISLTHAGNCLGTYLLARQFGVTRSSGAVAGAAFGASNYMLANIDSPHTAFFGVALLSLAAFRRYLAGGPPRLLYIAAVLAGLQAYFSAYVCLFLGVALAVFGIAGLGSLVKRPGGAGRLLAAGALGAALAAPFFGFYVLRMKAFFSLKPLAVTFAEFNSIDLQDLWNPLPGNLLYPEGHRFVQADAVALFRKLRPSFPYMDSEAYRLMMGASPGPDEELYWVSSRRRAFVGIALYALALVALLTVRESRWSLLALYGVGLSMALGPVTTFGRVALTMPLYPLYANVPEFSFFRIPGRAFALSVLALCILAARGLDRIAASGAMAGIHRFRLAHAAAGLLILAENVPFPLPAFNASAYIHPPPGYVEFFKDKPHATVVLNLPSGIGFALAGSDKDLYVFGREIIYINWQSHAGTNCMNGVNGYIPDPRIEVQKYVEMLPNDQALREARRMGLQYIVHDRGLLLPGERDLAPELGRSPLLSTVLEQGPLRIFEVADGSGG